MRAHFSLPSVESEEVEAKAPIEVKFEIPYFTTSGIQVRYVLCVSNSVRIKRIFNMHNFL